MDQQASQARTITAVVTTIRADPFGSQSEDFEIPIDVVRIENHGNLPVTDVVFHSAVDESAVYYWPSWLGLPIVERADETGYLLRVVLKPGAQCVSPDLDNEEYSGPDIHTIGVDLSFVDAEGLRWRRFNNGTPTRMPDIPDAVGRSRNRKRLMGKRNRA